MSIEEVLQIIWRKPHFYLNNRKSLQHLYTFLAGYEMGCRQTGRTNAGLDELHPFSIWVAKELDFVGYSKGWIGMIAERAESDERAFEMFYELFEKYKSQGRPVAHA